jgi:hypothetical protein
VARGCRNHPVDPQQNASSSSAVERRARPRGPQSLAGPTALWDSAGRSSERPARRVLRRGHNRMRTITALAVWTFREQRADSARRSVLWAASHSSGRLRCPRTRTRSPSAERPTPGCRPRQVSFVSGHGQSAAALTGFSARGLALCDAAPPNPPAALCPQRADLTCVTGLFYLCYLWGAGFAPYRRIGLRAARPPSPGQPTRPTSSPALRSGQRMPGLASPVRHSLPPSRPTPDRAALASRFGRADGECETAGRDPLCSGRQPLSR